jgi:hypothetical protein
MLSIRRETLLKNSPPPAVVTTCRTGVGARPQRTDLSWNQIGSDAEGTADDEVEGAVRLSWPASA